VTSPMSYLILEAAESVRTLQGSICLRYHDGTPKELLLKAIDVMRTGIGYPALFNDKSLIPRIESWGFSREQARDYVIFGCVYLHLPGLNAMHQGGGYTVLPKCLWWALHQGVDPGTGEQHGAPTKDPRTFRSVDDVMDAQAHPEKHHDLIVRVAGYSAYFVDLSKGLQDSIIERTEHVL